VFPASLKRLKVWPMAPMRRPRAARAPRPGTRQRLNNLKELALGGTCSRLKRRIENGLRTDRLRWHFF
jgi:hypothetical protein